MTAPGGQSSSFDDVVGHVAAEAIVWVRLAAICRDDGIWRARLLELTSGAPPPSWSPEVWDYPWAVFTARREVGTGIGEWLRSGKLALEGRDVVLPQSMGQVRWERRQSHAPGRYETLDWPVTETAFANAELPQNDPQTLLVSAGGAPSFYSLHGRDALLLHASAAYGLIVALRACTTATRTHGAGCAACGSPRTRWSSRWRATPSMG